MAFRQVVGLGKGWVELEEPKSRARAKLGMVGRSRAGRAEGGGMVTSIARMEGVGWWESAVRIRRRATSAGRIVG